MAQESTLVDIMKRYGFDTDLAMEICVDDLEIYQDVLMTTLEEGRKKLPLIRNCMEEKRYDRYLIEVHALKNVARTIGACELSGLALEQELAVRDKAFDVVENEGGKMIHLYEKVLDILEQELS